MPLSREDFTKYPFTRESAEYVKNLDLRIPELAGPDYGNIINRAEQRISSALIYGIVKSTNEWKNEIEIFSFPVAILLAAQIKDNYLKRRFALSEAIRASEFLISENENKILEIAKSTFSWKAAIKQGHGFLLSLVDFLRNATNFQDNKWKLINQTLDKGNILLGKDEFVRLLQEEIRKHIEYRIDRSPKLVELNDSLLRATERLTQILAQRRKDTQISLPKQAVSAAYPPCIKKLYNTLFTGEHISHMGRFTLTSFLLNVGMKIEDLIKLYTSLSDFDKEQTKYQIEHIAGEKGSRQKYQPPKCSTLRTHNLCSNADDLCQEIQGLISYYRRKLKLIKANGE